MNINIKQPILGLIEYKPVSLQTNRANHTDGLTKPLYLLISYLVAVKTLQDFDLDVLFLIIQLFTVAPSLSRAPLTCMLM